MEEEENTTERIKHILIKYVAANVLGWLSMYSCTCAPVAHVLLSRETIGVHVHEYIAVNSIPTSGCFHCNKPANVPKYFAVGWLYSHFRIIFDWQEVLKQQKSKF